jgi:dUTP pyrophosphatase
MVRIGGKYSIMKVRIKKLVPEAVVPSYANPGDAGLDLVATYVKVEDHNTYGYFEYGTGLSVEIPDGYVGLVFPRSSISKTGMLLTNSVGVIDSGYRGEIKFRFKYISGTASYEVGDRVGQLIILPYPSVEFEEVDSLDETQRGADGFGSTGK